MHAWQKGREDVMALFQVGILQHSSQAVLAHLPYRTGSGGDHSDPTACMEENNLKN